MRVKLGIPMLLSLVLLISGCETLLPEWYPPGARIQPKRSEHGSILMGRITKMGLLGPKSISRVTVLSVFPRFGYINERLQPDEKGFFFLSNVPPGVYKINYVYDVVSMGRVDYEYHLNVPIQGFEKGLTIDVDAPGVYIFGDFILGSSKYEHEILRESDGLMSYSFSRSEFLKYALRKAPSSWKDLIRSELAKEPASE